MTSKAVSREKKAQTNASGSSSRPRSSKSQNASEQEIKVGARLRHARLLRGLRLRDVAEKVGCSESFVSKLENDKIRPSLSMLHQFVIVLDINIASLFESPSEAGPVSVTSRDNRPIIRTDSKGGGTGVALERLIPVGPAALLDANIHCIEPGGKSDGVIEHEGEELGYVLEGHVELDVEGITYSLDPGDCFYFRSRLRHGYKNRGRCTAKILWVCTPPTF